jgi:hypothetical protein
VDRERRGRIGGLVADLDLAGFHHEERGVPIADFHDPLPGRIADEARGGAFRQCLDLRRVERRESDGLQFLDHRRPPSPVEPIPAPPILRAGEHRRPNGIKGR